MPQLNIDNQWSTTRIPASRPPALQGRFFDDGLVVIGLGKDRPGGQLSTGPVVNLLK